LEDLKNSGEIELISRYDSLREKNITGDFRYIIIDRIANYDYDFTARQKFIMTLYDFIKHMAIPEARAWGLDTSNCITEKVPLLTDQQSKWKIKRVPY
jgi:KUP system potassium uptake protein